MKKIKNKIVKIFSIFMVMTLLAPNIVGIVEAADDDLTITIAQNQPVDVVLTVGDTEMNLENFERDILSRLKGKGMNTERVKVTAIETQEVDVKNEFSWDYHGHDISDGWSPKNGKRISVTNNGRNLYFDGYRSKGYVDFMYLENRNHGEKEFTFQMDEGVIDYHAMEGAGFLFNTKIENGRIEGYAVIIGPEIRLYQINSDLNSFKNTSTNDMGGKSGVSRIATFNRRSGKNHDIKITADKDKIRMTDFGQVLIDDYRLPKDTGVYGFGPIASHSSHNCSVRSNFEFQNLSMEMEIVKDFTEVMREPEWRDGSKRFLVNTENKRIADFDDANKSGEILTRLINEDIDYIGVGSNSNKQQFEDIIKQNNGNGMYVDGSNYNQVIENVATYIEKNTREVKGNEEDRTLLVGEVLDIDVIPSYLKTNTQTSEYPDGRWLIKHDENYYENGTGTDGYYNSYQPDFKASFQRPGKYELWFGDTLVKPNYVYVHRKPVADFGLRVVKSGNRYNVEVIDNSYDEDRKSQPNRGIVEHEWKWKETTATNWNEGKINSSVPAGKDYVIQLRVKDEQGQWSDMEARYITTDSNILLEPIANFNIPSESLIYTPITVNDSSYDPAGREITQKEWTVEKGGRQVYKGSSPVTNFNPYGEGRYTVSLRVKNDANLWSETFRRVINIQIDKEKPTIDLELLEAGAGKEEVKLRGLFEDSGGSGFKRQRYAITQSKNKPSSGSSEWSSWGSSKTRNITITKLGEYYVHLEAEDNEGNKSSDTYGTYQIDTVKPNIKVLPNSTDWTTETVKLLVSSEDTLSGLENVEMVKSPIEGENLIHNSRKLPLNQSDNGNTNLSKETNDYVSITPKNNGNVYSDGRLELAKPKERGKEYTLSFDVATNSEIGFDFKPNPGEEYNKKRSIPNTNMKWEKIEFTYTQTGASNWTNSSFGFNGLKANQEVRYKNLKLEEGSKATPWTPSMASVTEVLELDEPLRSVGNVRDELYKDTDGRWKVDRKVGGETLTSSSSNIVFDSSYDSGSHKAVRLNTSNQKNGLGNEEVTSSHFVSESGVRGKNKVGIEARDGNVWMMIPSSVASNVNSFKNWLDGEVDKGVPLQVLYPLNSTKTEVLPSAQQNVLNSIENHVGALEVVKGDSTRKGNPTVTKPIRVHSMNNIKVYKVAANGKYDFEAIDKMDNKQRTSYIETKIDRRAPEITVNGNPTDWEKEDVVTLEIISDDHGQSGTKEITLPDGTVVQGSKATFDITENKDYTFEAVDNLGHRTVKTITVNRMTVPYFIKFVDVEGNPVKGGKFALYRDGEKYVSAVSDAKGKVDFGKVPDTGDYHIKQVKAPFKGILIADDIEVPNLGIEPPLEVVNHERESILPATGTLGNAITYTVAIITISGIVYVTIRKRKYTDK